jgi:hypothetical protein
MKLFKLLLSTLIVVSFVLACSGCTVKVENVTLNKTRPAGEMQSTIPRYPNANRTFYINNQIVGLLMTYQTNDSAKQVIAFYKTEMQKRGYNITSNFISSDESGGLIIFTKGNDRVYVTIGQEGVHGNTSIAIKAKYQA